MNVNELNKLCAGSFIEYMSIEFTDHGDKHVEARMPIDKNKLQPMGVLHGGVSLALAETVASAGSYIRILKKGEKDKEVLGLQVSGNHISTVSSGILIARAEIIHEGKTTHVWNVEITDQDGKLISIARVINIIKETKNK